MVFLSSSQSETEALGRKLGSLLSSGAFVALFGDLGGGKTCFVRGMVESVSPESAHLVASPTFAIMNEYPGAIPVYHFDFYRLSCESDIAELGFEDYFNGTGICIVEWSERLEELLPPDYLQLRFEHAGENQRAISIQAVGHSMQKIVQQLEVVMQKS